MRRRRLLVGAGACVGFLAGCGGQSGEPTETETKSPTATRTATPTRTATASPTPSATPTATPTPGPVVHEMGERFVVDEENRPFAYTVHEVRRTDHILTTSAAGGRTFLLVICTVENLQDENATFPHGDVWLRSTDVRKSVNVSLSDSAASDPRIRQSSLTGGTLFPGTPKRGVVAFDNAPLSPTDYRLLFTPPGTTGPISPDPRETHQVSIGGLQDVPVVE